MRLAKTVSFLVFFGFFISALAQTDTFEVITLRHRPAEALIPFIQPLMGDTGVVTGRNDQLILRAKADRHAQIRTLVKKLDTPPLRLLVSVQQLQGNAVQHDAASLRGDAYLSSNPSVIDNEQGQQTFRVELEKRTVRRGDNLHQQIQVLAGSEAFIQMGEQIPSVGYVSRVDSIYPIGHYGGEYDIQSELVSNGFYVRPQVHGDWVTLEILPNREQPSSSGGGRIIKQQLATSVTGRLGEWLEVSHIGIQNHRNNQAVVHSTQVMDNTNRRIFVKVDRLR